MWPVNGQLLSIKKEWSGDPGSSMDESQRHYAVWKEPGSKGYMPCDYICMTFLKRWNDRDKKQINGFQELGKEGVARNVPDPDCGGS